HRSRHRRRATLLAHGRVNAARDDLRKTLPAGRSARLCAAFRLRARGSFAFADLGLPAWRHSPRRRGGEGGEPPEPERAPSMVARRASRSERLRNIAIRTTLPLAARSIVSAAVAGSPIMGSIILAVAS